MPSSVVHAFIAAIRAEPGTLWPLTKGSRTGISDDTACSFYWRPLLSAGSFISGTDLPLSFAPWLSFRSKAFRAMPPRIGLDPLSLITNADLAELLVLAHSHDESIRQSRTTIEMDPNFALAHNQLALAYLQKHMRNEAVAEPQKAAVIPEKPDGSGESGSRLRRTRPAWRAVKLFIDLKKGSSSGFSHAPEIAVIYAALGDRDQAMNWLDKGHEERFNPGVLLLPGFDPIRSDLKFQELVRRIGLNQ